MNMCNLSEPNREFRWVPCRRRCSRTFVSALFGSAIALMGITVATGQQADKPVRTAQAPQSSSSLPPTLAEPPAASSAAACDANCVHRSADAAAQACVPLIEAKAPLDYDWLSRPFGGMFTQAEQPGADGIVRYRGDAIRVLTMQNQWIRHAYECAYDPVARRIVDVEIRPGRLVPPADVANFIADILKKRPGAQVTTTPIAKEPGAQVGLPPTQAKSPAAPRRAYGERDAITVTQSKLHGLQIDSETRIAQSKRKIEN